MLLPAHVWTQTLVLWDRFLSASHPDCVCPCHRVCRSAVVLLSPLSWPPYTPGWHHPPSTGPTSSQLDFRTLWMRMVWATTGRWTQVRNTRRPAPGLLEPKWSFWAPPLSYSMHSLLIEKCEPYLLLIKTGTVWCIGMDFLRQRIWPSVFSD